MSRTHLQHLIEQQVAATTVATVSRAVDSIAESLTEEILRDHVWRAEMRQLVQRAFRRTLDQLTTTGSNGRPRKRKAARARR